MVNDRRVLPFTLPVDPPAIPIGALQMTIMGCVSACDRSAVAMTAHTARYCVVVPSIRLNQYFIVQNGADRERSIV